MKVFVVTKDYQNLGAYEDHVCRYNEFVGLFKDLESAKNSIESDIDEDFEILKHNDNRLKIFICITNTMQIITTKMLYAICFILIMMIKILVSIIIYICMK